MLEKLKGKKEEEIDAITKKVYGDMLHTCWFDLPL